VTYETVDFDTTGGVARITLNRPHVLNAYNVQMRDELFEIFSAVRDDDEIWALVVRGAGRAFCAGADLTEFGTAPSVTLARQLRFARDVWTVLAGLTVPRIAVLHGFAFGSGLELAMFCDLRIAAEGTVVGLPEVQLGMIPAAGGTQTVARTAGVATALELLLTGARIDARSALRRRLVSAVVSPEALSATVDHVLETLRVLPRPAVRAVLRAIHEGVDLPLSDALSLEARLARRLR
jgi:enoyl-CoA hydratase/carnithine racemase